MRFQVMYKKSTQPKEAYLPFFESDDIAEIKDFAMRLAFIEGNDVYVQDTALGEIVRDFEDACIWSLRFLTAARASSACTSRSRSSLWARA